MGFSAPGRRSIQRSRSVGSRVCTRISHERGYFCWLFLRGIADDSPPVNAPLEEGPAPMDDVHLLRLTAVAELLRSAGQRSTSSSLRVRFLACGWAVACASPSTAYASGCLSKLRRPLLRPLSLPHRRQPRPAVRSARRAPRRQRHVHDEPERSRSLCGSQTRSRPSSSHTCRTR